ncbi:MAG: peptidoglycan-binding protein [Oscillospiraceae bacterium]|nr:peptidoglycan-binding protein [Oscillospiraceae bacterium]
MRVAKQPDTTLITDLQEMLRLIYPDLSLGFDGLYGPETAKAVEKFQEEYNLPITGVVDSQTQDTVRKAYKEQKLFLGKAHPLYLVLQPNQVIRKGENNVHLYVMQAALTALAQFYEEIPLFAITGILDDPTSRAVSWFQEKADLPQTGEIDKKTWAHLAHEYRQVVGDGTGSFPIRTKTEDALQVAK